jgi:hypothetical protein
MARYVWLAAALLATAANARGEDPCAAEVERLCPRARGDALLVGCLRSHQQELSKACKGDLDAVLAKAKEIAADCEGDVYRLCRDVEPGEGRVAACLRNNESHLSQSCQAAFNEWRLMRMDLVAACAGDIGRLCRDVPEGGGRIWGCLKANLKDLSSDCRAAVQKL